MYEYQSFTWVIARQVCLYRWEPEASQAFPSPQARVAIRQDHLERTWKSPFLTAALKRYPVLASFILDLHEGLKARISLKEMPFQDCPAHSTVEADRALGERNGVDADRLAAAPNTLICVRHQLRPVPP